MHLAAQSGYNDIVELLIKSGGDIDAVEEVRDYTIVALYISQDSTNTVQILFARIWSHYAW